MARSVYMCSQPELTLAECSDCSEVKSRVQELEECCDEVRTTLESHNSRISANATAISGKQNTLSAGEGITIENDVISAEVGVDEETFNQNMQTIADVDNDQCSRLTTLEECCETVNNRFSDYYTTSQTYTQQEIRDLLADLDGIHFEVVSTLPTEGDGNVIYILDSDNNSMWVYSDAQWIQIGDTSIDLSQYVKTADVINMIHPVGDTVIRTDNVNPGTLYSGTTWQKISEGRMLIGANSTYTLGSTGGVASNSYTPAGTVGNTTLTAAQSGLPAHTHAFTQPSVTGGGGTNNITGGSHSHSAGGSNGFLVTNTSNDIKVEGTQRAKTAAQSGGVYYVVSTLNADAGGGISEPANTATATHTHNLPAHTHSVSGGAVGAVTGGAKAASSAHNHSFTGTAKTINNMPPYLAVNIWIRTA